MLRSVHLLGVSPAPALDVMDRLGAGIASRLRVSCHVRTEILDAAFAEDPFRRQTYSTSVLARLANWPTADDVVVLGVTGADLYVPILTFVFGEAQMPGRAALVSLHRLREEFYGMPPDPGKLQDRLLKEALHELGHTQGLKHCADWRCLMTSSHAVEKLDVKSGEFCSQCAAQLKRNSRPKSFGGLL